MEPNKQDIKVVVGCPVADNDAMRALTAQAISGAIIKAGGKVIDMVLRRSCDIVANRTFLVNYALEQDATHLLFVDADMIFPADTINQLLSHEKEIIGVEYPKREFPIKILCEPLTEPTTKIPYKVKYTGTGLLLIDLSIFKDPKFGIGADGKKNAWFNFGRDAQGAHIMGEDVWFCNVAREAGYDVWVDPTLKVGHIGEYIFVKP
jgi:hypothetical protein